VTQAKVIVLIGIPGSGKSTWAAKQNATVISSDELRGVLSGDVKNQDIHAKVFATMRYLLRTRLELGATPTIIDATNIRRKDRKAWLQIAHKFGASVDAVLFDLPIEVALERNRKRDRVVPEDVIRSMAKRLQLPTIEEGFKKISTIVA